MTKLRLTLLLAVMVGMIGTTVNAEKLRIYANGKYYELNKSTMAINAMPFDGLCDWITKPLQAQWFKRCVKKYGHKGPHKFE